MSLVPSTIISIARERNLQTEGFRAPTDHSIAMSTFSGVCFGVVIRSYVGRVVIPDPRVILFRCSDDYVC